MCDWSLIPPDLFVFEHCAIQYNGMHVPCENGGRGTAFVVTYKTRVAVSQSYWSHKKMRMYWNVPQPYYKLRLKLTTYKRPG